MRILISTGIYPPKIGGPAQYSKNLKNSLELAQNRVKIATFGLETSIPTGLRHLLFLVKIIPKVLWADYIIVMDTFSVGLPTVFLASILGKKSVVRTGGDFLWEGFVERTKKKVLFRDFYINEINNFSKKEKIIFKLSRFTLQSTDKVIFSTKWQRDIFIKAYSLDESKTDIIENYYGPIESTSDVSNLDFIGSTRNLVWKNLDILKNVFTEVISLNSNVKLYTQNVIFEDFINLIKNSYAVVLVSLGDISPNLILDAVRLGKPFICTKEVGIYDRIKDLGIFVDPLNESEIKNAVLKLLDKNEYNNIKNKLKNFNFIHDWDSIAGEFLEVYNKIK